MAYPRPPPPPPPQYHHIAQPDHDAEHKHAAWETLSRPQYPARASPSTAPSVPGASILDPESDSSDVSDTGEEYRPRSQPVLPTALPPPISKPAFESQEAIHNRLREISRVEDSNIRKSDILKAKRARKDEKIRRKREAQDQKIKAIMDARTRRDERILRRRRIEDEAFERMDQELEEEENNLRRRMKRLKRGLPLDDIMNHDRSYSSASMSPPGHTYNNVPPAKRHQHAPPGQLDSPTMSASRFHAHDPPPANPPPTMPPQAPPYPLFHANHPAAPPPPPPPGPPLAAATNPPSVYSHSPSYSPIAGSHALHPPPPPPPPPPQHPPSHAMHPPTDHNAFGLNGNQSASPHASFTTSLPPPNPTSAPNTVPPPRPAASTYDTRPPPSTSTGFASVNQPPATGFAAINARAISTPPVSASTPVWDVAGMASRAAEYDRIYDLNRRSTDSTPTSAASNTPVPSGKRAPSTTHPYQMSEAFANRHHHCERVDKLNRGIWTYHGPGGTADKPTAPAQEMYLRCNHGDCRRIDWRTVHGLQCHIVKNHEQPKGTIGSLEKALNKYGVPTSEVEAYEREHGEGTGGTVADVKHVKLKQKPRDSSDRSEIRKWDGNALASAYRDNVAISLAGNTYPPPNKAAHPPPHANGSYTNSHMIAPASTTPMARPERPSGGFAAVNGGWNGSNAQEPGTRDVEMQDAPSSTVDGSAPPGLNVVLESNPPESKPTRPEVAAPVSGPPVSKQAMSSIVPVPQAAELKAEATVSQPASSPTTATAPQSSDSTEPQVQLSRAGETENLGPLNVEPSSLGKDPAEGATDSTSPDGGETTSEVKKIREGASVMSKERPRTADETKVGETDPETPHTKTGTEEGKKSAATSPDGSVTRIPMSGRRESSRRSSMAASKAAEKEKELQKAKEREEDLAAAEKAKEADPPAKVSVVEAEKQPVKEIDKKPVDDDGGDEEQGDSITVATTPGPTTRDRKERERDDTGGRTSKRLASGRHVNKKR